MRHFAGSGIRADRSDNVTIRQNVVYGNTWWTSSAPSAIVFAESAGTGTNKINENVVYGNRNFMPFFIFTMPTGGGTDTSNYGEWNQGHIIDGSGVYITRNQNYEGKFELNSNTSFENGINGLVVHKTTHENVTVEVSGNWIFDNGQTTTSPEGRQTAGGLTVNSGGSSTTSTQTLVGNTVTTGASDVPYQCFGTCVNTAASSGNRYCGGTPAAAFDASIFTTGDCSAIASSNTSIQAAFPAS